MESPICIWRPIVVSSDPASHLDLRSPRELMAVGGLIGMEPEDVEAGLLEWGSILSKNLDNLSGKYADLGVKRGKYGGSNWNLFQNTFVPVIGIL